MALALVPVGSRSMLKTREGDTMKLIKACVRTSKVDEAIRALRAAGAPVASALRVSIMSPRKLGRPYSRSE